MTITNAFLLTGQTAIVTGAGRGIGRSIAKTLAQAGANVVCASRTEADLQALVSDIEALGGNALAIPVNVLDETQLELLVQRSQETYGGLDILVNNAGGAYPNDALATSAETFNRDYNFNVTTTFNLIRHAAPLLKASAHGNIINITSAAARYAQPGFSSYGTVKAALTQLTKLLAADFAPDIRVNGIAPGTIMTEALTQFLDENTQHKMIELTPMRSLGQPEDIAYAALYLASPGARWVTGKILEVDGGAESTTWPF